jgi:hypothetical protein
METNNQEFKNYKYICIQCDFKCNEISRWEKHIESVKHKTGKRKKRSDYNGPYKCDKCVYETNNSITFKQHILNEHGNIKEREEGFKFYCKLCDFGTFSNSLFEKHNKSNKHIKHEQNYK